MPSPAKLNAAAIEAVAVDLEGPVCHVSDVLLSHPLLAAVRRTLVLEERDGALRPALAGHGVGPIDAGLRGDRTRWLEPGLEAGPTEELLAALDALRVRLNRRLFLGMERLEAHVACYPPGAAYVRHRDRFRDDDARVLSVVIHLNPDWPEGAGGALRLYLPEGPRDVRPAFGTVALFLSAEIEHEVLPAARSRWSIAGWFRQRCQGSRMHLNG